MTGRSEVLRVFAKFGGALFGVDVEAVAGENSVTVSATTLCMTRGAVISPQDALEIARLLEGAAHEAIEANRNQNQTVLPLDA